MTDDELIIDETNFFEHFHDVRTYRPQKDEVLARYSAAADFVAGDLKQQIIGLLRDNDNKAEAAARIMQKLACAIEADSYRVPREMAADLLNGLTPTEVEQKPYRYVIEIFYYTKKENIPLDDPHWSTIGMANLEEFLDAADNRLKMSAKIIDTPELYSS